MFHSKNSVFRVTLAMSAGGLLLVADFLSLPIVLVNSGVSVNVIAQSWIYKPVMVSLPLLPEWISIPYYQWCNLFRAGIVVRLALRIHDGTLPSGVPHSGPYIGGCVIVDDGSEIDWSPVDWQEINLRRERNRAARGTDPFKAIPDQEPAPSGSADFGG